MTGRSIEGQKHGFPALLSFFLPGLGQIVKGEVGKGLGILFLTVLGIGVIMGLSAAGSDAGAIAALFLIGLVPFLLWQIYDAYNYNPISYREIYPHDGVNHRSQREAEPEWVEGKSIYVGEATLKTEEEKTPLHKAEFKPLSTRTAIQSAEKADVPAEAPAEHQEKKRRGFFPGFVVGFCLAIVLIGVALTYLARDLGIEIKDLFWKKPIVGEQSGSASSRAEVSSVSRGRTKSDLSGDPLRTEQRAKRSQPATPPTREATRPAPIVDTPLSTDRLLRLPQREPQTEAKIAEQAAILGQYEVVYSTSVYEEPSEDSRRVARVERETRVNVVAIRGDWLEIRSKQGRPPGFIKKDSATPIGK